MGQILVTYEQALLTDIVLLQKRAACGGAIHAAAVTALFASYGTSFEALPHYLQAAIDRIDLTD